MKATIDGIACDGTPEEINEFKKLRDAINHDKLWKDLEKKEGLKIGSPIYDSVKVTSQKIISNPEDKPYDPMYNTSRQGIDTTNPDIKCETESK